MSEITTIREAEKAIQDLIDSFADDIFIDACEEMASAADVAKMARKEEQDEEPS